MKKKILLLVLLLVTMFIPVKANNRQQVTLSKCVDGDTSHFMVNGKDTTVRYLAINAPEYTSKKEPYGKEASRYVCDLLTNAKRIELEYDEGSDLKDKYGRTLAWVYADGKLVQEELVKQGLAEVKYLYGDYAYTSQLQQAEAIAKKQHVNMWSDHDTQTAVPYYATAGGLVLIIIGVFFTKGKRNKKRLVQKGIRQLRK